VSRIALFLSLSLWLSSLLAQGAPAAHAVAWQRPVDGPVLRAFALGANPYAGGQHRGVDLGAPPGSPVHSACAGRVSFAGLVPRGGRTVSVRCGEIVATYGQLGSIAVRRGQDVAPAATLGAVGRSGDPLDRNPHVHLGARDAATGRYIDPLGLLRGAHPAVPPLPPGARARPRPAVPLGPAPDPAPSRELPHDVPLGRVPAPGRPRALPSRPVRGPASARALPLSLGSALSHLSSPRSAPAPATPKSAAWDPSAPTAAPPSAPAARGVPWTAWVGLVSVGLALPFTGFVRMRRRRRPAAQVARTA
jgi:Peptidase family M23